MRVVQVPWTHTRALRQEVLGWGGDPVPGDHGDATWQGQGIGTRLIDELVRRSIAARRPVLWADARESAVGFYEACGATALAGSYRDQITGLADRRVIFDLVSAPEGASQIDQGR